MTRKRRRLWIVLACGVGLSGATALALVAFQSNLVFFKAPSDLVAQAPGQDQVIRLGGLVEKSSLRQVDDQGHPEVRFRVTDGRASVPVTYVGILPDLFREGQGIVAIGEMQANGVFTANEVLAKHDETYMPKDVAAALEKSGRWESIGGTAASRLNVGYVDAQGEGSWMIPELGHYALALAVVLAAAQAVLPLWGACNRDRRLMGAGSALALGQFIAVGGSFICLVWSAVSDNFSVINVAENSTTLKPLLYKITGTWGDHEGSILLWCLILALCGAVVAGFGRNLPIALRARVLGVLGATSVGFLLFALTVSDPFVRLWPPPQDGRGMNPLLQDPGLAFHPPVLYAGYVGFAIPFAFAVAALLEGRVDAAWARWVKPWTLASWCLLTCGIALGSWWAYYDLGWGGYWFWDPVENASLLPWLAGTALLHSVSVLEKREALKIWTILLAIATFSLSLAGTFMVRSGLLNSVHTFANDPTRGVFILVLLALIIGGSLTLFALRAPNLSAVGVFAPISREGGLVLNNVLLCSICAVVFIGTAYPPLVELAFGATLSVGPPYFNLVVLPLCAPLFLAMPIGAVLPWKRADVWPALQRLWWAALLAVAIGAISFLGLGHGLIALGFGGAGWLIAGSAAQIVGRYQLFHVPVVQSLSRMRGIPLAVWGSSLAHAGMGITVAGIAGMSLSTSDVVAVRPGQTIHFSGYEWTLNGVRDVAGSNYNARVADLVVERDGRIVALMHPSRRSFTTQDVTTTETAIQTNGLRDLYTVLGDERDGQAVLRLYVNPLAPWIWLGALVMAAGGVLSLIDRRLRLRIPARDRASVPA